MFDVTEEAKIRLSEMLVEQEAPTDVALRLSIEGGTLELFSDRGQESDLCFSFEHRTVLLVDEELADELSDKVLDWIGSKGSFVLVEDRDS